MKIRPKNGYLLLSDVKPLMGVDGLEGCLSGLIESSGSLDFIKGDRVFFPSKHIYRSYSLNGGCFLDSKAILGILDPT